MHIESELTVVTKAKDLSSYIFIVTNKSPKSFRFTLVFRLQNLSLNIIEDIFRANEIFIKNNDKVKLEKRLEFQHSALTNIKLLAYTSLLSLEQNCILAKQYEQITKMVSDTQYLLGFWIKSDKLRPTLMIN